MKYFLLSLFVIGVMAGTAVADSTSKPNLIFNPDTCMLRITPQDGQLLDGWYVCVTDRTFMSPHHVDEGFSCGQEVEITEHISVDMTPYLDDCFSATPLAPIHFGTLKSYYR